MAKNIYLLEVGNLNNFKDEFQFYDREPFTSKKLMEEHISRRIECNKGTNVVREEVDFGSMARDKYTMITYDSVSIDDKPMRIRYLLRKLELNRH